jgi:hypothetical protein
MCFFEPLTKASRLDTQCGSSIDGLRRRDEGRTIRWWPAISQQSGREVCQHSGFLAKPPINHGKVFSLVALLDLLVNLFCFGS